MKISATWSSSRIATRVSWALEEMIISLVMPEAPGQPRRVRHADLCCPHQQVRQHDPQQRSHSADLVEADLFAFANRLWRTRHSTEREGGQVPPGQLVNRRIR